MTSTTTKVAPKKSVRELKSLRTSARNKSANLQYCSCCYCWAPKARA